MAVAHTTLLEFLGKKITYDLAVDQSFDPSGYIEESGVVTGVLFELDGDHKFCVKIEGYSGTQFIKFSDVLNFGVDTALDSSVFHGFFYD